MLAAVPAIPEKPNKAATSDTNRNVIDQLNITIPSLLLMGKTPKKLNQKRINP